MHIKIILTVFVTQCLTIIINGASIHSIPKSAVKETHNVKEKEGAVAGRLVSIPAKAYRQGFKDTISLGQCSLVKDENGDIITCSAEFTGTKIFLPKASMTVDVSRVESSEDILLHVMGGFGTSVGVLGLVSVSPKINVAVTTETTKKTLNLISSYELSKGILTLHNPSPKSTVADSALFLSEIELGGNELFLVSLEFENEKKKIDVQITITFKILFISISAKLKFVKTKLKTKAKVRIQFKSSWRKELDESYSDIDSALPRVEEIETMYMKGPQELRDMDIDDEKAHSFYYFSSWKQSPYGKKYNHALINHDLEFLTDQNTEMMSVLHRIDSLKRSYWSEDQRNLMNKLNGTLTEKTQRLTAGLEKYHSLSPNERQNLRDLYGQNKAPLSYSRELNAIIGE
ncbi:uncharacterized protein [Parasteatoda tepidariorum]|uniref:uncharacterized protein n=1 Tax=Parasteatoda tepidariorum TaxID=114398 RepID=UPI001C71A6F3|nr:uncharacterized protein LOC107454750 [Parasteatoda tepidariorum]